VTRTELRLEAPVCVVGMGAQTPVGRTAPQAAAAVRARISRTAEHPYLVDLESEPMIVSRAPWLEDEPDCVERMWALAKPALRESLVALDTYARKSHLRLLVLLGLPTLRPGLSADRHKWLAQNLRDTLLQSVGAVTVEVLAADHASALKALELGCQQLATQRVDACLVGGVDSFLCAETLNWLESEGRLFSARNPRGVIPGEAAAFCLLMMSTRCHQLGLLSLAGVASVATAKEPAPLGSRAVCTGEGLSQVFRTVLEKLAPTSRVDYVLCDLNGEPYRADEFAFALARTSERFIQPCRFRAPVDCWGDVGAATGALLLVLAASAWQRGYAPGTLLLASTSSGANSLRAATLLQAPPSFREHLSCR
jgi:3-oxoacyl-[acyl-carrier-protein] synthase I